MEGEILSFYGYVTGQTPKTELLTYGEYNTCYNENNTRSNEQFTYSSHLKPFFKFSELFRETPFESILLAVYAAAVFLAVHLHAL